MRYQFETADDATFILDMVQMRWGRVSSILGAPSVKAAENEAFSYNLLEEGELIPMGGGVYNLQGRTPKTDGAGKGLCTVGVLAVPYVDTLQIYLRANVPLKEDSFKSGEITTVKHHIVQAQQPKPNMTIPTPPQLPEVQPVVTQ